MHRLITVDKYSRSIPPALIIVCWLLVFPCSVYAEQVEKEAGETMVSPGPGKVLTPSLIGKERVEAESILTSLGLGSSVTLKNHEKIPKGAVIDQDPAPEVEVELEEIVSLIVSLGSSSINAPNFLGQTRESAVLSIATSQFMLGEVKEQFHPVIPKGLVIKQIPEPGTHLAPKSSINLVVSKGKNPGPSGEGGPEMDARQPVHMRVENKSLGEAFDEIREKAGVQIHAPKSVQDQVVATEVYAPDWDTAIKRLLKGYSVMEISNRQGKLISIWILPGSEKIDDAVVTLDLGEIEETVPGDKSNGTTAPERLERLKKKLDFSRSLSKVLHDKLNEIINWPKDKMLSPEMFHDADLKDFFELQNIKSEEDLAKPDNMEKLKLAARRQVLLMEKRARQLKVELQ